MWDLVEFWLEQVPKDTIFRQGFKGLALFFVAANGFQSVLAPTLSKSRRVVRGQDGPSR